MYQQMSSNCAHWSMILETAPSHSQGAVHGLLWHFHAPFGTFTPKEFQAAALVRVFVYLDGLYSLPMGPVLLYWLPTYVIGCCGPGGVLYNYDLA